MSEGWEAVAGLGLADYRVLVTGGSRGIGAACCRLFALAGATVAVQYRERMGEAESLVDELKGISQRCSAVADHLALPCDVAHPNDVDRLFAALRDRWRSLDVLVNNAGVWLHDPLPELHGDILRRTLAINVEGAFLCARGAVPLLRHSPNASIVNLGSTAGQRGEAQYSAYAASKGAIGSATKSWATELAPDIRVNCVAPGWVDTDMTAEALAGSERQEAIEGIPLGRIATPEDIAGPVLFLASPLARHITGEILNVNGGSVLAG